MWTHGFVPTAEHRNIWLEYSPVRTSLKVTELCAFRASFNDGWLTSRSVMSPPAAILSSPLLVRCSWSFFWFAFGFFVVLDWLVFFFWFFCCTLFFGLHTVPGRKKERKKEICYFNKFTQNLSATLENYVIKLIMNIYGQKRVSAALYSYHGQFWLFTAWRASSCPQTIKEKIKGAANCILETRTFAR